MPTEVIMPKVDMDMASGKVATWHVAIGEKVEKGMPLFDIETDKAAMEVEAPAAGYLHHIVPAGSDVPIGAPVGWLYGEGEEVGEAPAVAALPGAEAVDEVDPDPSPDTIEGTRADTPPVEKDHDTDNSLRGSNLRATPLARSLAANEGIDLHHVEGSGPRGRIQSKDVRGFLEQQAKSVPQHSFSFADESGPLAVTRSAGGTGTPVVLIHGFANDATGWLPLERHLRHRPLIRIDLPCHGKSPLRRYRHFGDIVSDVRQAVDALGEEKFHLVAHSLGGAMAIAVADTRPRNVASLNLIAPAGLGPEINGDVLQGILRATKPESLAPWLKLLVADEKLITDGYARAAMATRSNPHQRAAQLALAETVFPDGTQAHSLRSALERVTAPTRIIWGKRDAIIPWRHALSAPGNVALHLFEHLGHMPHVEASDQMGVLIHDNL